jgi:hypothetical protein
MKLATLIPVSAQTASLDFLNHNRPVLDAHNCYPYQGCWELCRQNDLALGGDGGPHVRKITSYLPSGKHYTEGTTTSIGDWKPHAATASSTPIEFEMRPVWGAK